MNEKVKAPPVEVIQNGPWFQVPTFFVESLMQTHWHRDDANKTKIACLPNSFWKYSFFLWAAIIDNRNHERKTIKSMRLFPVQKAKAIRWTAAYAVSGLYDVDMGSRTGEHDDPTIFTYRREATKVDWELFVSALEFVETELKERPPIAPKKAAANTGGFKVMLALKVDELRVARGLPPVNKEFLAAAVAGTLRNQGGERIARNQDGRIAPLFYEKASRFRGDESDEDFDYRLRAEEEREKSLAEAGAAWVR